MQAFVDQVVELRASGSPHPDGRRALASIERDFRERLSMFDLEGGIAPEVADGLCTQAIVAVRRHTPVLGFVLRSTNVRNPFELHFPLKKLVQATVSPDAQFLMSSEWNYVPFTYPMTIDLLSDHVLVGVPAPESANVLIVPLAGHEIGHSVWARRRFDNWAESLLAGNIRDVLEDPCNARETGDLQGALAGQGQAPDAIRQSCLRYGLKQLEEVFCDLFGLHAFGEGYLHAFDYFLAPGGGTHGLGYPSTESRIRFISEAAGLLGLAWHEGHPDVWLPSKLASQFNPALAGLTEQAVARSVPALRDKLVSFMAQAGVVPPHGSIVERVTASFERREPDAEGASLPEVVAAGWAYLRKRGGLSAAGDGEAYRMLGELMLKSVEVSEFGQRSVAHA